MTPSWDKQEYLIILDTLFVSLIQWKITLALVCVYIFWVVNCTVLSVRCVTCFDCGATTPGVGCQWMSNYTQCGPCASKTMCPVCKIKYNTNDLMIQCAHCERYEYLKYRVCCGCLSSKLNMWKACLWWGTTTYSNIVALLTFYFVDGSMALVMALWMRKNLIKLQNMDITVCIVGQKPSVHLLVSVVCLVELHLLPNLSSPSYLLLELILCTVSKYVTVHPSKCPPQCSYHSNGTVLVFYLHCNPKTNLPLTRNQETI